MRKTHLSLAVSRAWSGEMPVGDPYGGPAYGERNMPVVAVGAAVWGGAALAAGGLTVFGTIAAIGAVTAGIGVVTGNKTLSKIGGIMGLIGGVGGLASGSGLFTEVADTAGGTFGGDIAGTTAAGEVSGAAQQGVVAGETMVGVVPETTVSVGGGVGPVVGPAATNAGGLLNSAPGSILEGGASMVTPGGVTGAVPLTAPVTVPGAASGGIMKTLGGYVDSFGEFAKKNPMAAYGMMNTAGNLIGGAFDPLKPAQVDALEAQTDLAKQRQANMNAPLPTAVDAAPGGVRPNPYAVPVPLPYNQVPINTGLINNAGLKVTGTV